MSVSYPHTMTYLKNQAGILEREIMNLLEKNNKQASGRLINSIKVKTYVKSNIIYFEPSYINYGKFVLSGRRKNASPPPVAAIMKWVLLKRIKVKGGKLRTINGKVSFKKADKQEVKSLAYAISRKIGQEGIRSFNFLSPFDKRIKETSFKNDLKKAIGKDTTERIVSMLQKDKIKITRR